MLAKPANLVDFLEDIRELAKLSGVERYFSALGAKRSPKTFVGLGVTAKFVPGVGGSQITHGSFTIIVHKDVTPVSVHMLWGLDLLAGRGNYRHAILFFYLLVLFGIAIGRVRLGAILGPIIGLLAFSTIKPNVVVLLVAAVCPAPVAA